jgi:hypothetical protein
MAPARALATAPYWHEDAEAGVRFPVLLAAPAIKSGAQASALALEGGDAALPDGIQVTSGVYAPQGVPYALVWKRTVATPWTRYGLWELERLRPRAALAATGLRGFRFDARTGRGAGTARGPDGLKARVTLQAVADGFVAVGWFYRRDVDADGARVLESGLRFARPLTPESLPWGFPATYVFVAASAVAFATGTLGFLAVDAWRRRRRRERATPAPDASEEGQSAGA